MTESSHSARLVELCHSLPDLCATLAGLSAETDRTGAFPAAQLEACGQAGVFGWFLGREDGGLGWDAADLASGYMALSRACLTTAFVITQRAGAIRRIAGGAREPLRSDLLPGLATGRTMATVGISHLTTSRRHVPQPPLAATPVSGGYLLDGYAPWVTGGCAAQLLVVGASVVEAGVATGEELLLVAPTDRPGVVIEPPSALVALAASCTGRVNFNRVLISEAELLAGPATNVMALGIGGRAGGHETSALALGLAGAALDFLRSEADCRTGLGPAAEALIEEHGLLEADLLAIARGEPGCGMEALRQRANSHVLRSTQAALAAAKGAGFVAGHPVGRWCREALFFLVWSCPQGVLQANLCELAGIQP